MKNWLRVVEMEGGGGGQINHELNLSHWKLNQRTNGPVDAHLLGLVKHKTWKLYGKEMTLTFNTHIPS